MWQADAAVGSSVFATMLQQQHAAGMACHAGARANVQLCRTVGAMHANTHEHAADGSRNNPTLASMLPQAPAGTCKASTPVKQLLPSSFTPAHLPAVQSHCECCGSCSLLRPGTALPPPCQITCMPPPNKLPSRAPPPQLIAAPSGLRSVRPLFSQSDSFKAPLMPCHSPLSLR